MKKTILLMDNDADFLHVHARLLTQAGYDVLTANSIPDAAAILENHFILLAILDIRMEDDNDLQDISGLKLAEKKVYQSVPKIILTAFPSWNYAEMALGVALEGMQIVGMADKADGPDLLLQRVEQALEKHIQINENLLIHWNGHETLSLPTLLTLLEPKINAENLPARMRELEGLFRQLFCKCQQITISRLFKRGKGILFLGCFAYTGDGKVNQYIITCGQKEAVEKENAHYDTLVPQATAAGSLVVELQIRTVHFAAIAYPITGGELAEITNFADFYYIHPTKTIIAALGNLFEKTTAPWYQHSRTREEAKTTKLFFKSWLPTINKTEIEWEEHLRQLCLEALNSGLTEITWQHHRLQWHIAPELSEMYPNPIPFLFKKNPAFDPPFLCGVTHGQLGGDSILVGPEAQTWLIDFSQVDQGPLVRDFVALETAVKLDLLTTRDIKAIHELEKRLLAVFHLNETPETTDLEPAVQKAAKIIGHIRSHAANIIGSQENNYRHYLGGLFLYAMAKLVTYDPIMRHSPQELTPYFHALLSASMLCKQLEPSLQKPLPPQAVHSLWIADDKEVWIENQKADLTPREFELLTYLYQHRNKVCDRIDIAQAVFNATFDHIDKLNLNQEAKNRLKREEADPMINSTMNRLRKKVEVNPRHDYVVTERGKGYRLDLSNYTGT